jgi:hypothetical protein
VRRCNYLLATLSVLALAACGPSTESQQQSDAAGKIEKASKILEYVQNGTIADAVGEPHNVKGVDYKSLANKPVIKPYGKTINEYRQEQFKKAGEELAPLSKEGRAAQQMATQLLLAEVHASAARNLVAKAAIAWGQQGTVATTLISTASSLRITNSFAAKTGAVDYTAPLTELRTVEKAAVAKQDELAAEVKKGSETVATLEGQIKEATAGRQAKAAEADDLARKAFTAKGQAQYDLYVKSAAATRESDKLNAKNDLTAAKLDIEQAQFKVAQARLDGTKEELAQTREAIKALEKRGEDNTQIVASAKKDAGTLDASFAEQFKKLSMTQQQAVTDVFKAAEKELEQAQTLADAAGRTAPQDARHHAELFAANVQAETGFLYRQEAAVASGYADLVKSLSDSISTALPADRVQALADAAKEATTSTEAATKQATDSLTKIAPKLHDIADAGKSATDKPLERSALKSLIQVNASLASLSGATDAADKNKALQDRLNLIVD